jgi:hypothetical protein
MVPIWGAHFGITTHFGRAVVEDEHLLFLLTFCPVAENSERYEGIPMRSILTHYVP